MKDIIRFTVTLLVVCLLSSGSLSLLYNGVKDRIEKGKILAQEEALNYALDGSAKIDKIEREGLEYFKAFNEDGTLKGFAVICSGKGFSSTIKTACGFGASGTIIRIRVIEQQETPGLGSNLKEVRTNKFLWDIFTGKKRPEVDPTPYFQRQFFGINYNDLKIVKTPSQASGEIQALTGATISSKAVMESIRAKIGEVLKAEGLK